MGSGLDWGCQEESTPPGVSEGIQLQPPVIAGGPFHLGSGGREGAGVRVGSRHGGGNEGQGGEGVLKNEGRGKEQVDRKVLGIFSLSPAGPSLE